MRAVSRQCGESLDELDLRVMGRRVLQSMKESAGSAPHRPFNVFARA